MGKSFSGLPQHLKRRWAGPRETGTRGQLAAVTSKGRDSSCGVLFSKPRQFGSRYFLRKSSPKGPASSRQLVCQPWCSKSRLGHDRASADLHQTPPKFGRPCVRPNGRSTHRTHISARQSRAESHGAAFRQMRFGSKPLWPGGVGQGTYDPRLAEENRLFGAPAGHFYGQTGGIARDHRWQNICCKTVVALSWQKWRAAGKQRPGRGFVRNPTLAGPFQAHAAALPQVFEGYTAVIPKRGPGPHGRPDPQAASSIDQQT